MGAEEGGIVVEAGRNGGLETQGPANASGDEVPERLGKLEGKSAQSRKKLRGHFTNFQAVLEGTRRETAKKVEASGLVNVLIGGQELPERVPKRVTDGEFRDVARKLVTKRVVGVGDAQLGKEGSRRSEGSLTADVIAAKQGMESGLNFEGEGQERADGVPERVGGWSANDDRVVSADTKG